MAKKPVKKAPAKAKKAPTAPKRKVEVIEEPKVETAPDGALFTKINSDIEAAQLTGGVLVAAKGGLCFIPGAKLSHGKIK